jgi:hypothetical protein
MINYKEIEIKDKNWIEPLVAAADIRGCHYNFTNLFAWSKIYKYNVAQVDDYLLVKGEMNGFPYYFFPAGQGNPQSVLEAIGQEAVTGGYDFAFAGLSTENLAMLNSLFPADFEFTERRDSFDYVYLLDKLVTLTGDKLKAKRNHVNHFRKNNIWSFEQISSENLAECWEMNIEWCKAHGCEDEKQLANENCAVRRCFDYFTELGLEGGLLRSAGRVVAYTMGDKLNADTYDIHIEKALEEIQGAYQMINREFATLIQQKHPEMIYVNREEDMGMEGLRKAKLSYRPIKMEKKYWGKYISLKSL